MAILKFVASDIMDMYFQDFAPQNTVFAIELFKELVATVYKDLVQSQFDLNKRIAKAETGYSTVPISSDLLIAETVTTQKDKDNNIWYTELGNSIYFFNWDAKATGVQYITDEQGDEIKIISNADIWMLKRLPVTKTIFAVVRRNNRIDFFNGNPCKVVVRYIPDVDAAKDDCYIADSFVPNIRKEILNEMFFAKNGLPVDKTNDQNPNATIQTEIDKRSLQNQ